MIDIDKLSEDQLIDLNHRIVERLRLINQMRAHKEMLEYSIGDRVSFQPDGRGPIHGTLTRYNKKTVTIIADNGGRWNVSPTLIRPSREVKPDESAGAAPRQLGE